MSNPIELQFSPGKTVYVVIHNPDGRVWNANTSAWEAYNSGHWANYAVELTEQAGSGYYRAAFPITDVDVLPTEAVYQQMGVTPVIPSDPTNGDQPIGTGQSQGSDVFALNASVLSASNLKVSAGSMEQGTVQAGANSASQIVTDLSGSLTNLYAGRVVIFTSGAAAFAARIITGYVTGSKILTFDSLPVAPSPTDTFVVV